MMKLRLTACGLLWLFASISVAQTTSKELTDSAFLSGNIQTPIQLINGLVPGVLVSKSNTTDLNDYEIRTRGFNTYSGRTNPLIVLNGMVIPSFELIDPNNIQSISVLRGAETSKYGMQGASGVIEINTKTASKDFQLNYHGFANVDTKIYRQKVLSAEGYLAAGGRDLGTSTDWVGETTRPAFSQVHGVSFSQGFKSVDYRVGINYRGVQGIQKQTGYDRVNGSLDLNWDVFKFLKVNYYGGVNNQLTKPGFVQVTRFAELATPTQPVYFESGDYYQYIGFDSFNPSAIIGLSRKELETNNLLNRLRLSSTIGKLNLNVWAGQSYTESALEERFDERSYYRGNHNTYYDEGNNLRHTQIGGDISTKLESGNWWIEPKLTLDNQIYSRNQSITRQVTNGDSTYLRHDNYNNDVVLLGGALQADIVVANKWNLSVGDRLEASSALAPDVGLQHFPWLISRVNVSKIMGFGGENYFSFSHGKSGLTPYQEGLSRRYEENGYVQRLANSTLQNEVVKNTDIGLDWTSGSGRLSVGFKWYWKTSSRMITEHYYRNPIDDTQQGPMYSNFGKLSNRGLELGIQYREEIGDRIQWNSSLVMTTYSSEWKSLRGDYGMDLDSTFNGNIFNLASVNTTNYFKEGQAFGTLTAVKVNGFDDQGNWNFEDANGNGTFDYYSGDIQIVGQAVPKMTFGWMNDLSMDRIRLEMLITGAIGHTLFNESAAIQQPNVTQYTTYNLLESYQEIDPVSDRYIVDYFAQKASFLRLSNIKISYQLKHEPQDKLSDIQLYFVAHNLLTLSSYPGNNPDYSLASAPYGMNDGRMAAVDPTIAGMDRANRMYSYRSFTIGVRAVLF